MSQAALLREIEARCGAGQASSGTVSNWWTGKSTPDVTMAQTLARILGVSLEWMADADMEWPPETGAERTGLSDDERAILRFVRGMGADEAIRRLSYSPGTFGIERTGGNPPASRGEGGGQGGAKG